MCVQVLRAGSDWVWRLRFLEKSPFLISGSYGGALFLWDFQQGKRVADFFSHPAAVVGIFHDQRNGCIISGDVTGEVIFWGDPATDLSVQTPGAPQENQSAEEQVHYTNAKVLLIGESGAGKTALSRRLVFDTWAPTDSTLGAWATQWKLPASSSEKMEREIWIWDFGGQADQRLIHQLYMDETALAVLVVDAQKDDMMETLAQWDQSLVRSSRPVAAKLLVAGRSDVGGIRTTRKFIESFVSENSYAAFIETSAKTGFNCDTLRTLIVDNIRWEEIPWRSSPVLFKRLKEEIVSLKDNGNVLFRFKELREILKVRLEQSSAHFSDEELRAVIGLLAGPGVVWELKFGSWILLQPQLINSYAQSVIQTMRDDESERGCIAEDKVLNGDLAFRANDVRLELEDERFVFLAMHQTLVTRGVCLRHQTDKGVLLVFPRYYRRERKELVDPPGVLVSYKFEGFLDEIYATLVVKLHHTDAFVGAELWRYAADFETLSQKKLGLKLSKLAEGSAELEVYFDREVDEGEKIIFSKYVHDHLLQFAENVTRLRHYICPHCQTPVGNREVAMRKLAEGKKDVLCVDCEQRIPLWDRMEELFADEDIKERVTQLKRQASIILDNESKDRALVGEVISTVALAGQISREFAVSDHGIDMEIEFKDGRGQATGDKLYLQLKSGDSHLRFRQEDRKEIFSIKNSRHADYWASQAFPVMLVVRSSQGLIRWMEIGDILRNSTDVDRPKQIAFEGEKFDVMSILRMRDHGLRRRAN